MRKEDKSSALIRLEDAEEYLASAKDNLDKERNKASLDHAVDATIAANDAFTIAMVREVGTQDHREALALHGKAGRKAGENRSRDLAMLLELRHRITYRPVSVSRKQASSSLRSSSRFVSWVRDIIMRG